MRILRPTAAAEMLGVSKCTLWRWQRQVPNFPVPFQVGPNSIGFDEAELQAFLEARRVVRPGVDELRAAAVDHDGRQ